MVDKSAGRKAKTSIQLSKDTKKKLDGIGHKGDTYDSIVRRLLERYGHETRQA